MGCRTSSSATTRTYKVRQINSLTAFNLASRVRRGGDGWGLLSAGVKRGSDVGGAVDRAIIFAYAARPC